MLIKYRESVNTAEYLSDKLNGKELTFLGHSLGGGLAAANALKTGKNAITFNSEALTAATKDALGLPDKGKGSIFNVVVKGEIVDYLQTKNNMQLEGGKYELKGSIYIPEIPGILKILSYCQRIKNHSINTVIKKLEEENKK